jgi:quercetin dioxygenase-like cupin family protein
VVEEEQEPCVVRREQRPRVDVGGTASRAEVLSARPKRNLELIMVELAPGVEAGDQRHYHHSEACLLCTEGQVRLRCGDHVIELSAGDSCHYDGRMPHAIENPGGATARVLIATTPAAFEPMFRVTNGREARAQAPELVEALS